jgi:acetoin utilization deacetylase AcuC-like enzyme/GNAT superfamily N-acetyltransferase
MIRIRRVYSTALPIDRQRLDQVQRIFRENFPSVADYAETLADKIDHAFKYGYRTFLLVSEASLGKVTGFSLLLHLPEVNSTVLDFIAVDRRIRGGGIGSALYEATRQYVKSVGSRGLYMEVLPDDPAVVKNKKELKENQARLAFYEAHGVFPIAGTEYETPIDDAPAPYLLFDPLGRKEPLKRSEARSVVRLLLRRKYAHLVPPDYIERVVESFTEDPVRLREPRYGGGVVEPSPAAGDLLARPFILVYDDRHRLHHVHERGYVERPARVGALVEALLPTELFSVESARNHGETAIRRVHEGSFVTYLKAVCKTLEHQRPVYPYVFPIRRPERKPRELAIRAGYYCIDTFTPLDRNAYEAARASVNVSLTAMERLLRDGSGLAYALCRPPGHHAERRVFGGFCYFNNAAIAANELSRIGPVAVIDLDFHHGNGTQDIFYRRADVLTISIHGHPNYAYPYFSGFSDETGEDDGRGFNFNFPLAEGTGEEKYFETLQKALKHVRDFRPHFLVVSLGLDTMRRDPTGAFMLTPTSMKRLGHRLGELNHPTLVVQEGGYNLRNLRRGAVAFFSGFAEALSA